MKSILQDFWLLLPDTLAKPSAGILFALLLVVIWILPVKQIYEEKPTLLRDLRIWSSILLILQLLIYAIF
ncbi:MAG: hypothetical protein KBA66_03720 [Leptospiraceae bacterium]|nr:hypothetical protein [Leptospiraceae bacterium]